MYYIVDSIEKKILKGEELFSKDDLATIKKILLVRREMTEKEF